MQQPPFPGIALILPQVCVCVPLPGTHSIMLQQPSKLAAPAAISIQFYLPFFLLRESCNRRKRGKTPTASERKRKGQRLKHWNWILNLPQWQTATTSKQSFPSRSWGRDPRLCWKAPLAVHNQGRKKRRKLSAGTCFSFSSPWEICWKEMCISGKRFKNDNKKIEKN